MPDDSRLEAALRDLGRHVAFPPTPELRAGIAGRLPEPNARRLRWRPALLVAIAATLLIASVAAAFAFGLAGLRITFTDHLPTLNAQSSSPAAGLRLGERVTLASAEERSTVGADWPRLLGEPDEVYLSADRDIVSLVYLPGPDLPPLAGSDVGLLVMEIDGSVDAERIEKLVHEVEATVTSVSVGGLPGYWIEGRPHVMRYEDPGGANGEVVSRLVGDVLVWESGGAVYRIESGLGLEATLRLAESMEGG